MHLKMSLQLLTQYFQNKNKNFTYSLQIERAIVEYLYRQSQEVEKCLKNY